MIDFEIGKTYISKKGMPFTVIEMNDSAMTIQCRLLKKKAKRVQYCGVNAALFNFGEDMILAEKITPVEDPTIEFGYNRQNVKINAHGVTYVNLFKKIKEKSKDRND